MGIYNGLRALLLLSVLQGCCPKIVFPSMDDELEDNNNSSSKHFIRSMEIMDSGERDSFSLNPERKLRDGDGRRWNDWEWEDEEDTNNKKWGPPDEKTISFQVLDEDPFHHGRPAWPHDEYILGMGHYDPSRPYLNRNSSTSESETVDNSNLNNNNNNNNNNENIPPTSGEMTKYYEWKRLQPRPSPSSSNAFIGPGFYDVGSSSNNYYDTPTVSPPEYYRYHFPTHQAITTEGGVEKIQTGSPANGETVPGTPSESNTNTRHFSPYHQHGSFSDYYKRKRLRLQIHPGLIAAPLAGLAAFGAASALTSKPLLVELGYVRNKPHHGIGGGGVGVGGGGWGYAGSLGHGYRPYPPFYPPPNPPPIHHPPFGLGTAALGPGSIAGLGPGSLAHGHAHSHGHAHGPIGGTLYPILRPNRGRPDGERSSSWWNPFSSLTPRLVIE